jgi:hypothetical protein
MKLLRLIGGIVLSVLLFSGCVKEECYTGHEVPEGSIVLVINTLERVSESMLLKVTSIEDNRCPIGVICSSMGDVTVHFESYYEGEFSSFQISYSKVHPSCSATNNQHEINVVDVFPYPYDGDKEINLTDYRVYVRVDIGEE